MFLSGYVVQICPYYGRQDRGPLRIYEDVCLKLCTMGEVLGKQHHIYMDNYFSSVPMFKDFLNKYSTYCCGTLRKNRAFLPKNLMVSSHQELPERGSTIFSKCSDLLLTVWRDRKVIHILSSIHGSQMMTCTRNMKDKKSGKFSRAEIPIPISVKEYSKFMGGVDLTDQMTSYYSFARKSQKWTKKIFWFIIEVMKVNSWVLYNSMAEKPVSFYEYTLRLLAEMFLTQDRIQPQPNRHLPDHPDRLQKRCMPHIYPKRSYCKVCYEQAKYDENKTRSQTRFGCDSCGQHLCIPFCFVIYHTIKNYETYKAPQPQQQAVTEE